MLLTGSVGVPDSLSTPSRPGLAANIGIVLPGFRPGSPREPVERVEDLNVVPDREWLCMSEVEERGHDSGDGNPEDPFEDNTPPGAQIGVELIADQCSGEPVILGRPPGDDRSSG